MTGHRTSNGPPLTVRRLELGIFVAFLAIVLVDGVLHPRAVLGIATGGFHGWDWWGILRAGLVYAVARLLYDAIVRRRRRAGDGVP